MEVLRAVEDGVSRKGARDKWLKLLQYSCKLALLGLPAKGSSGVTATLKHTASSISLGRKLGTVLCSTGDLVDSFEALHALLVVIATCLKLRKQREGEPDALSQLPEATLDTVEALSNLAVDASDDLATIGKATGWGGDLAPDSLDWAAEIGWGVAVTIVWCRKVARLTAVTQRCQQLGRGRGSGRQGAVVVAAPGADDDQLASTQDQECMEMSREWWLAAAQVAKASCDGLQAVPPAIGLDLPPAIATVGGLGSAAASLALIFCK